MATQKQSKQKSIRANEITKSKIQKPIVRKSKTKKSSTGGSLTTIFRGGTKTAMSGCMVGENNTIGKDGVLVTVTGSLQKFKTKRTSRSTIAFIEGLEGYAKIVLDHSVKLNYEGVTIYDGGVFKDDLLIAKLDSEAIINEEFPIDSSFSDLFAMTQNGLPIVIKLKNNRILNAVGGPISV